jgi:hypothetical protein
MIKIHVGRQAVFGHWSDSFENRFLVSFYEDTMSLSFQDHLNIHSIYPSKPHYTCSPCSCVDYLHILIGDWWITFYIWTSAGDIVWAGQETPCAQVCYVNLNAWRCCNPSLLGKLKTLNLQHVFFSLLYCIYTEINVDMYIQTYAHIYVCNKTSVLH